MKKIQNTTVDRQTLCASVVAALAALALAGCGGGGGSAADSADPGNTGPTNPLPAQITGKAIDGYLTSATVCLDTNANDACDAEEPATTTDATGAFTLPYSDSSLGKKLLVLVTPATKDLSRPAGFQFPASFTLSQLVTGQDAQHVTPLTTMVLAQMETGLSQPEAILAVQTLLGQAIDPNADYVANNDTATASLAARVVDKLASFADGAVIGAATQRNVLNAIIAKNNVTSVDSADVAKQASKPVFTVADATQVLSQPIYSFLGYLISVYGGGGLPKNEALVRQERRIIGTTLETIQQENQPHGSDAWVKVPLENFESAKYEGLLGQYQLKADGTWSAFYSASQLSSPEPLSSIGTTLVGSDTPSGIPFSIEYRQADFSGQPLSLATPSHVDPGMSSFINFAGLPSFSSTPFASGTKAYLSIKSYAADRIILPVPVPPCDNATITSDHTSYDCGLGNNPPTRSYFVLGNPSTAYTSVEQAIGITLKDATKSLQLSADGGALVNNSVAGTWKPYTGLPNVLVIDVSQEGANELASLAGWYAPIVLGAKMAVVVHEGRLRFGWLYPKSYTAKAIEFISALPAELVNALHAASANRFPL